jgi:hypothetical protein
MPKRKLSPEGEVIAAHGAATATGVGLVTAGATRWGGTPGVGFEYAFTPNWSFGVEYDRQQLLHHDRCALCGLPQ